MKKSKNRASQGNLNKDKGTKKEYIVPSYEKKSSLYRNTGYTYYYYTTYWY